MDQGFLVHTVYSALYTCALLTWTPRLLWHALRGGPATAGLGQRLGQVPPACRSLSGGAIWIHAVSVGEVHAARGLLPHLRRLLGGPVVISTTTPTGQALATESGADSHCYMPLDLDWALKPFFRALRPRLLILVETEALAEPPESLPTTTHPRRTRQRAAIENFVQALPKARWFMGAAARIR